MKIAKFKESLKRPRDCSCGEKNGEAAGDGHLTTEVRKTEPEALNQVSQMKEGLQKEGEVSKRQRNGRTGKCLCIDTKSRKLMW